ncbi:hypothetical protein SKAU_G00295520 [Synaphobranchus kaupii]|uniref:Uncharacterized protein n=1 Tax=Synaphobranchus kaupii TaxID=118154 RepID=A0A9Q1IMI7_SYNKA|nr:hypothetical protein SKAU_G00295520 [Synaphobranchus kaupii]
MGKSKKRRDKELIKEAGEDVFLFILLSRAARRGAIFYTADMTVSPVAAGHGLSSCLTDTLLPAQWTWVSAVPLLQRGRLQPPSRSTVGSSCPSKTERVPPL